MVGFRLNRAISHKSAEIRPASAEVIAFILECFDSMKTKENQVRFGLESNKPSAYPTDV